jgi:hypothetical protein
MALFKKTILTLLLIVPFLYLGTALLNAYDGTGVIVSEPEIDNYGADMYHYMVGEERAYIHMAVPLLTYDDLFLTLYQSDNDHSITFNNQIGHTRGYLNIDRFIWNPDKDKYGAFVIETIDENGNYVTEYSSANTAFNELRFISDENGINIYSVKYYSDFGYFDTTHRYTLNFGTKYRMYWQRSTTIKDITVDDLPNTTGSPYASDGNYGAVSFKIDNNYLDVSIFYENTYELKKILVDDISIFKNVRKAYYYTDNDEKFITFTYSDSNPVFLQNSGTTAQQWVDTLTWNLRTNEIRSINKVEVYAYHDIDSNRNVYTYMYIPNLIYDQIISVTAGFKYQYEYYIGSKGKEQQELITLLAGENNTFSPTWEKKLLSMYGNAADLPIDSFFRDLLGLDHPYKEEMSQIELVSNPSLTLKNKIVGAWNETYNTNVLIDEQSNKLYKLNWGQYDKFGVKKVNLIENTFYFAEIVFAKDGKVSILDFDDIILKDIIDDSLKPSPDFNFWQFIKDMFTKYPIPAITVSIILVILLLFTLSPFIQVFVITMSIIKMMIQFALTMALKPFFWIIASIIVVLLLIL